MTSLAVDCAFDRIGGVIGHDEDLGDCYEQLNLIVLRVAKLLILIKLGSKIY